jgi:uncharacterized membrane protein YhaH (DUF805 family)
LLPIIFAAVPTFAPLVVCYFGARMERGGRLSRVPYLIRLIVPWAIVLPMSYYAGRYMFVLGMGGSSGLMLLTAGMVTIQCVAYWFTGLLMAKRLNDMGTAGYRWLAGLAGLPVIGLLIPLVIGFLPSTRR